MTRYARRLPAGLALAVAVCLAATAAIAADDDKKEVKEAQKDILKLTKAVENDKEVDTQVAAIKKKYEELNTLMHIYKPKFRGGLGFGADAKNGLEAQIQKLDRSKAKAVPAGVLTKEGGELIKLAYVNLAMAKITREYFQKDKGGKTKKDWNEHIANQEKASKDLIEAVKKKDGARARTAIANINAACNNCHSDFRD